MPLEHEQDSDASSEAVRRPQPPPPPPFPVAGAPFPGVPGAEFLTEPIRSLLDADGSVVLVVDFENRVLAANDGALALLDVDSVDAIDTSTTARAVLVSLLDHVPHPLRTDPSGGTWHGDLDYTGPTGRHHMLRCTVVSTPEPTMAGSGTLSLIAHDVTEARNETEQLRHRALHDPLTGLANRRQVIDILRQAITEQRGQLGHVAVLFIDLDRLKYVNDALGHAVGDRLLVSTAGRLDEAVRPIDHVARIGGDEFLVVCTDMPDAVTALELAERVRSALSGRLHFNRLELDFSVSIGVALTDAELLDATDERAASQLISHADTAMYEAKTTGRGRCVLFTTQMQTLARERTQLAASLSHAIANFELDVVYQPVFSAVTQSAVAAEALVRWNHPVHGWVDPSTFVLVAEESGLVARLGEVVLQQSLTNLRVWITQQQVPDTFSVHVNVSPLQLASSSFVNVVLHLLRTAHLRPENLVLEARESALTSKNVDIERSIRALRRVGVRIAIDNFGTGANALSVLTEVGADYLKLDGALGLPSGASDSDTRVVRALVLLAHALGMEVVAERVSGIEQLRRLRAAGCDYVQGNLLGEPTSAGTFVAATSY